MLGALSSWWYGSAPAATNARPSPAHHYIHGAWRRLGWHRDLPDQRDPYHTLLSLNMGAADLPAAVDLREKMPDVYDQGHLGSCTANAIGACLEFDEMRQKEKGNAQRDSEKNATGPALTPSRLFIYWNERALEGHTDADTGAAIRDGIRSVATTGYCRETSWPYDITRFREKPPAACYEEAAAHRAVDYRRVPPGLKPAKALLAAGQPIVIGISVYDSFQAPEVGATGDVPLPGKHETLLGGHAILLVGYDDSRKVFLWRNSWGAGWGAGGYGTIPYDYILNPQLAADAWTVTKVTLANTPQ